MTRTWSPVHKREGMRLLAWIAILVLPMSVASCDGELTITRGYEYGVGLYMNSFAFLVTVLGIGALLGAYAHIVFHARYTTWNVLPIALWQLLFGLLLFMVTIDWMHGSEGWFQKELFFPLWTHYGVHVEGQWYLLKTDQPLPFPFNSKENPDAVMLDGITPVALLGVLWWTFQSVADVRFFLRGRRQSTLD